MSIRTTSHIQDSYFDNYQENGTIYLKNKRRISPGILEELLQRAGEIYLSRIPETVKPEQLASIASLLGELYVLRFKVNFARQSRGFAYLQYTNPGMKMLAIQRLPHLFDINGLGQIRVRQSKNSSTLVLRNVFNLTPEQVKNALRDFHTNFRHINVRIVNGNQFEYQVVFKCNDDAVRGKKIMIVNMHSLGRAAEVTWDHNF